jgi:hypothetical protein
MDDAAIHRVSGEVFDLSLRFLVHSGSPRPQGARDDKRDWRFGWWGQWIATGLRPRDDNTFCHCEEGAKVTDAAIHRVSGEAYGFVSSFSGSQWIATGFALAMTKLELGNDQRVVTLPPFQSSLFTLHS